MGVTIQQDGMSHLVDLYGTVKVYYLFCVKCGALVQYQDWCIFPLAIPVIGGGFNLVRTVTGS